MLLKIIPNGHGMSLFTARHPLSRKHATKLFQSSMADFIGKRAGPDPLDTQRCFAPPLCLNPSCVSHGQGHSSARNRVKSLGTKLQRHSGLNRKEVESN